MSVQPDFVHLHNHTQYSLLDGACKITELVETTRRFGQPAVAITDHGNLFGAVEFHKAALKAGIKPIIGCEVYVAPRSRLEKQDARGIRIHGERAYHLILLVENEQGYSNLVKLVSLAYLEGFHYRPRVDHELLEQYSEGLIALSACIGGEVPSHILHGDLQKAEQIAGLYREIFGPQNFFLELQDHGMDEEAEANPELIALARKLEIPLVATNDCHYLTRGDAEAHDILLCIQTGKVADDEDRLRFPSPEFYVKTPDEMNALFSEVPEALGNTGRIAERCQFNFKYGTYHLPVFDVPEGKDLDGYFEEKVREGFGNRLPSIEARLERDGGDNGLGEYHERLQMEIDVIKGMGFSGYFLITWDVIHQARLKGIAVGPGRGSAVGSLVSYCLEITDLDPLEYNLLFERFLNPERVSMPDIDIDFCQRRRDEAIEHVRTKYGSGNVAQIITFGTLKARQTIRDVGRVLEIPYSEVDRIAKMIPMDLKATVKDGLKEKEFKKLYDSDERVKKMVDVSMRLEGLARHASKHAAGVVIAPREITEFCPLYRMTNGDVLTQFTMNHAEAIGLLKMDFLGLRTLTVIEDALENIRRAGGTPPDLSTLTLDDPQTFRLLCDARTGGIFQFEKGGAQDILRRLHPDCFEDLIAVNALNRPGPLQGGMVDDFIERRHGERKSKALLPQIEEILKETYGIVVYQEQVMRIARTVAGFSMGEADDLRKAMSKKQQEKMDQIAVEFQKGAAERKINKAKAQTIWNLIAKFGEYGFNKSHSTAYALLAYQTAYLKTHFPIPFMAALLTSEKNAPDKMVEYLAECRDMGIQVLPPDINESEMYFSVAGDKIRFGLSAVKNVGESAIESILEARQRVGGRYTSFYQFFEVVDLRLNNRRVMESLIRCGGFDSFGFRRAQLWTVLDRAMETGQRRQADLQRGQHSLFGDAGSTDDQWPDEADKMPEVEEWPESEVLGYEKELLGYFVTGHPLTRFSGILSTFATADSRRLAAVADTVDVVAMGGIVSALSRKKTRKGDTMATFVLEDLEGRNEVVVFPKVFEECQSCLVKDRTVMVIARLERSESRPQARAADREEPEEENIRLLAVKISPLESAREQLAGAVTITIGLDGLSEGVLEGLRLLLAGHSGKVPLQFVFQQTGGERITLRPSTGYFLKPSLEITRQLEELLGEGCVRYHPGQLRLSDYQKNNSRGSNGNRFVGNGGRGWG